MKELERKRAYKEADKLLNRAIEILKSVYVACSPELTGHEAQKKAA